jgi:uncharacterized membrane protein YphA (DoxX/SURF4 family)
MNNDPTAHSKLPDVFALLARWILALAFVYMGLSKAVDPVGFLKSVQQYGVVHNHWLLNSLAASLPWLEIFCGLLLMAGIAIRGTALLLLLMLVVFTGLVLDHALGIMSAKAIPLCAVKFDCGCGTGEIFVCRKLAENLGLIIASTWLIVAPSHTPRLRADH